MTQTQSSIPKIARPANPLETLETRRAPFLIGYYDASAGRGGTTRYLLELLSGLDRQRYEPVFFALTPRAWHDDIRALCIAVVTEGEGRKEEEKTREEDLEPFPMANCIRVREDAWREAPPRQEQKFTHSLYPVCEAPPSRVSSLYPASWNLIHNLKRLLPSSVAWTLGQGKDCRRLTRLFRRRCVDLLHTNETGSELSPLAARIAGVPHILGTWHVDSTYDLFGERQSLRYRLLERASMRALHGAIAVSADTRRDWVKRCGLSAAYEQRVQVIYNGIEVPPPLAPPERARLRRESRARLGIPDDALVVGSLGRLAPAKGYAYLLEAVAQLRPWYPSLRLLLAGRGPDEDALRKLAAAWGIADCVQFLGFVADTQSVLACLDVYAQPSLCETLGIAILEASAWGLPVVASRVGGIPEVVVDSLTGRLVESRDVDALSAALSALLAAPHAAQQMGRQGRERVLAHFTRAEMVTRTMDVYGQMLT